MEGRFIDLDGLFQVLAEVMRPSFVAGQAEDWRQWSLSLAQSLVPGDDEALIRGWIEGLMMIMERLVEVCGGQAFLVDRDGQIVAAASDPPIDWSAGGHAAGQPNLSGLCCRTRTSRRWGL